VEHFYVNTNGDDGDDDDDDDEGSLLPETGAFHLAASTEHRVVTDSHMDGHTPTQGQSIESRCTWLKYV